MSTLVGGPAPTRAIPRNPELIQILQSNAIYGETRRFKKIGRFESFYETTQYDHLKQDWWGMNADNLETVSPEIQVPFGFTQPALDMTNVRMKRPTAPYHLVKAVVDRFTGFLFSESRRPTVSVLGDQDTENFLLAVIDQCRFWAKLREARAKGGSCGSVLVTTHVRNGKFSIEVHNPKQCQMVWHDRRTLTPAGMLKLYRFPVEVDVTDKDGNVTGTEIVEFLYRRIITDTHDIVYKPVQLLDDGSEIQWEVESETEHNLGFFPGVWIQNLPALDREDGDPDCHGAWQTFDTIDRVVSQMNKAVLLNLDPTLVTSVDPKVVAANGGIRTGSDGALNVGVGGSASFLEISGSGVEAGHKLVGLLRQQALDVVRCVMVDPQTISGAAQSAKAIEYIYAPMLEKADDLRAQYGDLGIVPLLQIIEKMARELQGRAFPLEPDETGKPRILKYSFDLPPKSDDGKLVPHTIGPGGYIQIKWGPYFPATEDDKEKSVRTITAAKSGGLIDKTTAIQQGAPLFGVRDVAAVEVKIDEEQAAESEKMSGGGFGGFGG